MLLVVVARTYHDLLGFGKVVDGVCIELEATKRVKRGKFLGDDFGRVQDIKPKGKGLVLFNNLDRELPLRAIARLDGIPEILPVEVGILAGNVLGLVPDQTGLALLRLPVPLDELGVTVFSHEAERVNTETVLGTVSYLAHPLAGALTMCL